MISGKEMIATLLVVDDSVENLQILSSLLKDLYKVKVAKSGEKALEIARMNPAPDLILLDIMMPGMDGFEVCSILKSQPETKAIPIIFLRFLSYLLKMRLPKKCFIICKISLFTLFLLTL